MFAAIPSVHVAFASVCFLYSIIRKDNIRVQLQLFINFIGVSFAALYLQHHYVIDVLIAIVCVGITFIVYSYTVKKNL